MEPVSNVDQIVQVLRQRLQARAGASSAKTKLGGRAARVGGLERVKELAAAGDIDERQLRRTLIQNILADQFGGGLVNEAKFQQVVERVTQTLEDDEQGSKLLSRLLADLRRSG